jgi:acyl carrier protein
LARHLAAARGGEAAAPVRSGFAAAPRLTLRPAGAVAGETAPAVSPAVARPVLPISPVPPATRPAAEVRERVRQAVARVLFVSPERVTDDARLPALGMDSILAVELAKALGQEFGVTLPAARLYDFASVAELGAFLAPASEPTVPASTQSISTAKPPLPAETGGGAAVAGGTAGLPLVLELLADALLADPARVAPDTAFTALGLDSILAVEFTRKLQARLGRPVPTALLYDQVTPRRLAAWLEEQGGAPPAAAAPTDTPTPASAVAPTPVSGFLAPERRPAPRLRGWCRRLLRALPSPPPPRARRAASGRWR